MFVPATLLFCFHSISALSVKDFTQWNALLNYIIVSFLSKPYAAKFFILKNLHMQIELSFLKWKRRSLHAGTWQSFGLGKHLQKQPNVKDTIWFLYFKPPMLLHSTLFPPSPQLLLLSPFIATATRGQTPSSITVSF
jgi:hypothetical protein